MCGGGESNWSTAKLFQNLPALGLQRLPQVRGVTVRKVAALDQQEVQRFPLGIAPDLRAIRAAVAERAGRQRLADPMRLR
jgi:hypothetical protein